MFTITRCVPFLFNPSISALRISGELYSVTSPLISTMVAVPDCRVEIFTKDGPCCLFPSRLQARARTRAKRSEQLSIIKTPRRLNGAGATLGLLQHHIRGLHHYRNRIADLQIHFFHAAPRNHALHLVFAYCHHHVSHEVADLQFLDLAYQSVACRNSHAAIIPCAREPVEAEIGRESNFSATAYFVEYSNSAMPLPYTLWPVSFNLVCFAGGGSSGIPPPSSTGITATSTVSTSPASRKLRNSKPPPNNHMSLPGSSRNAATVSFSFPATIVTSGKSLCRSVRENTIVFIPGVTARPCFTINSNVPRPISSVSNCANSTPKSISESPIIQSNSPCGPAM